MVDTAEAEVEELCRRLESRSIIDQDTEDAVALLRRKQTVIDAYVEMVQSYKDEIARHEARLAVTDEAVERAAIAICDARLWPGAWQKANEVERGAFRFEARAALEAR